jgi:hypothetical protein
MPYPVLMAYVEALPAIQAAETLSLAQAMALGSGAMERSAAARYRRDLVRRAGHERAPRLTGRAAMDALRQMGVRMKPKRKGA